MTAVEGSPRKWQREHRCERRRSGVSTQNEAWTFRKETKLLKEEIRCLLSLRTNSLLALLTSLKGFLSL